MSSILQIGRKHRGIAGRRGKIWVAATRRIAATRLAMAAVAAAATLASARAARAVVCTELPGPVYVTGSTAAKPILSEVAKILIAQTPPVTVVYAGQGSCAG